MFFSQIRPAAVLVVLASLLPGSPLGAQAPSPAPGAQTAPPAARPSNELDAFMEKVLARREVNRKTLEQYILDETESFHILGPGRTPLHRTRREFSWYVRDGMHVRSPMRFNGVAVGEDARNKYETEWIARERQRQEREAKKAREKDTRREPSEVTIGPSGVTVSGGPVVAAEPRFVSEAYFMDFKFEAGNYYLAGREQLEGHEVLKIEYYPTRMFGDADDRRDGAPAGERQSRDRRQEQSDTKEKRRDQDVERDIERKMNKTALITLWVDPAEYQIVKYTFDNVWLDFLPAGWLVRVDDIRASMTMGQPFPGVWLPRGLTIHSGVTLASGSFEAAYGRGFANYRLAEVATKMRIPKQSSAAPRAAPVDRASRAAASFTHDHAAEIGFEEVRGPFVPDQAQSGGQEIVGEVRIHGNAFLTDRDVLDIAGIAVGQPLAPNGVEAIEKRLKDSKHFESVEVRKRYRSLASTTDVAIVLVVHEKPGVRSAVGIPGVPGVPGPIARSTGRLRSKLMFLPIVSFADGYGFTYGGRMSTVDLLGAGERLSVPLTWGGTRRAALEFERLFERGPLTRIESSVAIWNRRNPRFEIRDQRVEVKGRAERVFRDVVRVGVDASRSTIAFADLDDRLWTLGSSVTLDTRLDPAFPGNAVLVTTGWTGLNFRSIPDRVNRYTADARGYLRVFRQIVVAGRAQYAGADATLPPYERLLIGGSSSLRGFRTGTLDGDRTLLASAEVRAPITSVLSGGKFGVIAFVDAAKAWNVGESRNAVEWNRGVGGGVFLIASVVRINLDVARGLKTGDTRVHLSSGFSF